MGDTMNYKENMMNCIIKSWRCQICEREEFHVQPKKRHFRFGKICYGRWECYSWRRQLKPLDDTNNN